MKINKRFYFVPASDDQLEKLMEVFAHAIGLGRGDLTIVPSQPAACLVATAECMVDDKIKITHHTLVEVTEGQTLGAVEDLTFVPSS